MSPNIVLIDYGAGNPHSVQHGLAELGFSSVISRDVDVIRGASHLIFPGVGAAASAMNHLREYRLIDIIDEVTKRGTPFLGICLGMQMLFDNSDEDHGTKMLGLLPGRVCQFEPKQSCYKVPHIGWNRVVPQFAHPLFVGLDENGTDFYFVHSYYVNPANKNDVAGVTDYAEVTFASVAARKNIIAVQFHPEKSGDAGLQLLHNFVNWNGHFEASENQQHGASDYTASECMAENFSENNKNRTIFVSKIRSGLKYRVIPCLDVIDKRVTKGVCFQDNIDCGDPAELAHKYYLDGADELVVYDITASPQRRSIDIDMVREVARVIHIPFAVGGGIASLSDMYNVLDAGAEKVSINSLAVQHPEIISDGARIFGRQCIVLGLDPVSHCDKSQFPCGYEVTTHGFRNRTGRDAVQWAQECESRGVGEIVVNSVDRDGMCSGFELDITEKIASAVSIPVIASGGAGKPAHFVELFQKTVASAAIVAGMLHRGESSLSEIKQAMQENGLLVRR
ncbi:MAG: imidazole glycerol phosphate synthase subunit HisF [Thermoguttaceae bacterium]